MNVAVRYIIAAPRSLSMDRSAYFLELQNIYECDRSAMAFARLLTFSFRYTR